MTVDRGPQRNVTPLARINLKQVALVDVVIDPEPVRFDSLSDPELEQLLPLTNNAADHRDSGGDGGSAFRERIADRMNGEKFPGVWVVRAWDATSRQCVGWSMFDIDRADATVDAGFYVGAAFRRQGIARCLINEVRRLAKERFHATLLRTRPWNLPGRRFFDSIGARAVNPELRELSL